MLGSTSLYSSPCPATPSKETLHRLLKGRWPLFCNVRLFSQSQWTPSAQIVGKKQTNKQKELEVSVRNCNKFPYVHEATSIPQDKNLTLQFLSQQMKQMHGYYYSVPSCEEPSLRINMTCGPIPSQHSLSNHLSYTYFAYTPSTLIHAQTTTLWIHFCMLKALLTCIKNTYSAKKSKTRRMTATCPTARFAQ